MRRSRAAALPRWGQGSGLAGPRTNPGIMGPGPVRVRGPAGALPAPAAPPDASPAWPANPLPPPGCHGDVVARPAEPARQRARRARLVGWSAARRGAARTRSGPDVRPGRRPRPEGRAELAEVGEGARLCAAAAWV